MLSSEPEGQPQPAGFRATPVASQQKRRRRGISPPLVDQSHLHAPHAERRKSRNGPVFLDYFVPLVHPAAFALGMIFVEGVISPHYHQVCADAGANADTLLPRLGNFRLTSTIFKGEARGSSSSWRILTQDAASRKRNEHYYRQTTDDL